MNNQTSSTVWVLWWKYSDNSAQGVARVYENEARATQDLELIKEHSMVSWVLTEVPLFSDRVNMASA